jgi:hypothetical protein
MREIKITPELRAALDELQTAKAGFVNADSARAKDNNRAALLERATKVADAWVIAKFGQHLTNTLRRKKGSIQRRTLPDGNDSQGRNTD